MSAADGIKEPTCDDITTNDLLLGAFEKRANEVVNTITECIDAIRSIQEFYPPKDLKKILKSTSSGVDRMGVMSQVFLYQILKEKGLVKKIQNVCCSPLNDSKERINPACVGYNVIGGFVEEGRAEDVEDYRHPLQRERERVVYEIFLPLLDRLVIVFHELDKVQGDPSTTNSPTTSHEAKSQQLKRQKPQAPRGLLSLSNYTDIACLLELTVCTSILPLLEPNILKPAGDRVKYLPRTLAGRLHRKSLQWGTEASHDTNLGDVPSRNKRATLKIQCALKELSDAAISISKVLLMDRFRPMLLPRHVTDIHAALFQIERLGQLVSKRDESHINAELMTIMQSFSIRKANKNDGDNNQQYLKRIDYHTMARSYQSLLQSGKLAPPWIKARVSKLLTEMAISCTEGFVAIIDVFVVAAASLPTEQITSASARLGRVLCAKPPLIGDVDSFNYYQALFDRALDILLFQDYDFATNSDSADNRVVSCVLTVWSLLENLPTQVTHPLFYSRLVEWIAPCTLVGYETFNICSLRNVIRRISSLLLFPPNVGNKAIGDLCMFLLSGSRSTSSGDDGTLGCLSVMSQLLRIVTARGNQAIQSETVSQAKMAIHQIIYVALLRWSIGKDAKISNEEYLAVCMLRSLATNSFDMDGYYFERNEGDIVIKKRCDISPAVVLLDLENRASFIVNSIMLSDKENSENNTCEKRQSADEDVVSSIDRLTGSFFELQLLIYFQSTYTHESCRILPRSLASSIGDYKILSMMLLPMLCEKCSPRRLFAERKSSSCGIFRVVSLIILSTSMMFNEDIDSSLGKNLELIGTNLGYEYYDNIRSPFDSVEIEDAKSSSVIALHGLLDVDLESQLSTTSLVLSILLAILELGSNERQEDEESILKQLVPSLSSLAKVQDLKYCSDKASETSTLSVLQSEVAEMASYAAALIEARSSKVSRKNYLEKQTTASEEEKLSSHLDSINIQILSEQPPVRAHAVCELRKLAKGILQSINHLPEVPSTFIHVESSDESQISLPVKTLYGLADSILGICVSSLTDAESYVYLACIQTIVSMADENPRYFMPIVITAISSGTFKIRQQQESSEEITILTSEQRVKLAEAMTFIIRRRGRAVDYYSTTILNALLYGKHRVGNNVITDDEDSKKLIQVQTEKYFHGETETLQQDDYDEQGEDHEEKLFRLKTGGPIFHEEENDVLRSTCISVVSELLSAANPSSLAKFCPAIVPLAADALKLDHSRLVRRASAMLSREIYSCALRESSSVGFDNSDDEDSNLSFNISLLHSGEDALYMALKRAIKGDDLDLETDRTTTVKAVLGKTRLYDPATVTRCQEALNLREELEQNGTMHLAALVMKSNRESEDSFIKRFVLLEKKKQINGKGIDLKISKS